MPGYVIAQIDVTDAEAYEDYKAAVPQTITQYGGRYIVRGGPDAVQLEGEAPYSRIVVAEFESVDAARAWYDSPEYQAIVALRHKASRGVVAIYEGAG